MSLRDLINRFIGRKNSNPKHLASDDDWVQSTEYEGYARYVWPTLYRGNVEIVRQGRDYYIKVVKETKYQEQSGIYSRYKVYIEDGPCLVSDSWKVEWIPLELAGPCRYSLAFVPAC